MIKVLIVDDHQLFRSGLSRLLSEDPKIAVEGEAASLPEALEVLRRQTVHVVIADINLAGRSGLELLSRIRQDWPGLPVLMISMYPAAQFSAVAMQKGANGYLSKDVEPDELLRAVKTVAKGGRYDAFRISASPACAPDDQLSDQPHLRLTDREMQIFNLILTGAKLTEIGEQILLSVKTVSTYKTRIMEKLGVNNNAELIQYAIRHGILVE